MIKSKGGFEDVTPGKWSAGQPEAWNQGVYDDKTVLWNGFEELYRSVLSEASVFVIAVLKASSPIQVSCATHMERNCLEAISSE